MRQEPLRAARIRPSLAVRAEHKDFVVGGDVAASGRQGGLVTTVGLATPRTRDRPARHPRILDPLARAADKGALRNPAGGELVHDLQDGVQQ
eukprot:13729166-Alexandrium_andersonii.AAC.1